MKKMNPAGKVFTVFSITFMVIIGIMVCYFLHKAGNGEDRKPETALDQERYELVEKFDFSHINPEEVLSLPFDYAGDTFFGDTGIEPVTAEQVSRELSGYLAAYSVYEKILDRGVKKNDLVNVDYTCMDKETSASISGGTKKNLLLDLSDNDLPEDVLDAFSGVMPGTSFQQEAVALDETEGTFTDENGEEISLKGRTLIFSFTVNYICGAQRTEETITDSDIMDITEGDYHTVPEFMEFIRTSLTKEAEDAAAEDIWDRWASDCPIGDNNAFNRLVQEEFKYEMGFYQSMADARGIDMDSLAVLYGCDDAVSFRKTVQEDSAKIVKQYLAAYYVANEEGLVLNDAELLSMQEELVREYGLDSVEELKKSYGEVELKIFLQMERIGQWMIEQITSQS